MMRMNTTVLGAAVLLAFAIPPVTDLSAQEAEPMMTRDARPGNDIVSLNFVAGGFFSATELDGSNEFDNTATAGGTLTYWAHRNVGVRANLLWAAPEVLGLDDNPLVGEDPNVWHYSGDLVLRMPLEATERLSWFPYIVGGLGGKTYDFETLDTTTDFAGNVGAGVELRFGQNGRFGINTEVRDFLSSFDDVGFDKTLNDVIWTGGIGVNF